MTQEPWEIEFDLEFSEDENGIKCVDEYSHLVKDFIRIQIDLAEKRGEERERERIKEIISKPDSIWRDRILEQDQWAENLTDEDMESL